jgi:hypothetical protein
MRFIRALAVFATLTVSATSANAQSEIAPRLTGLEAILAITGSTIVADGQYGRVVMFIAADHTLDVFQKGERKKDQWSDKTNQFCIEHESPCAKVTVFGTQGVLDYNGNIFPFRIEPGNQVDAYAAKG